MSILTVTVETTDRNVVCEVADMLRRLIAVERQCGEPTREYLEDKFAEIEEQLDIRDFTPAVDAGSAFGLLATGPDGHGTVYTGTGEINLVPFNIATSTGSPLTVPSMPTPPLAAEQAQTHTAMPLLPTPPIVVSGVKLDGEGLPWDRRIHASTKTLRQSDNTWKLIRGVTDALVDQVKAELRAAMGMNAGQAIAPVNGQPPVITPPAPPAGPPYTPVLTLVPPLPPVTLDADKGWPDPPSGPVPAATPVAPPVADPYTYTEFVQFCTSNQQSGKLAFEVIKSTCEKYGITQLPMINARHDLIPVIRAELESLCK